MKESVWGYLILVLGIVVIVILLLIQRITTTTEEDFYLGREVMEASMLDAVDYGTFRTTGKIVMSKEKFVEVFIRRFAESITNNKDYQLDFYDIYEEPPKATVRVRTVSGDTTLNSDTFDIKLDTYMHGILESVYGTEPGTNSIPTTPGKGSGTAGMGALTPYDEVEEEEVEEEEETKEAPPLSCDVQTKNTNYNTKFANGANLRDYGCGYTSISMVARAFGKNVSPEQVANDIWDGPNHNSSTLAGQDSEVCGKNGASTSTCGRVTTGTLTNDKLLGKYGLSGNVLFNQNTSEADRKKAITDALNRGEAIILRIPNHYIAISGSPDKIQLCNPWDREQNGTYTVDTLFSNSAITNWHGKCGSTNECGIWYGTSYSTK